MKLLRKNSNNFGNLLLNIFIIIPLIIPEGLSHISWGLYTIIYNYWGAVAKLIIFGLFMSTFLLRKKIACISLSAIIFLVISFVCTYINEGSLTQWFSNFSICIFTCMLIKYNRDRLVQVVNIYYIIILFFLVINLLCMIQYPGGMYISEETKYYQNWFLGYKSSLQYYVIPAMCFSWLRVKYNKKLVEFYLTFILCIFESFLADNAMLIVGSVVMTLLALFNFINLTKLFNIRNYIIAILIGNVVLIFFNTWFVNTSIGRTLLHALGKGTTLTWRASVIWPNSLSAISQNIIFGNGVLPLDTRRSMYGNVAGAIHAHNQLLEILFIGGIVLFASYVLFHVWIYISLNKYKKLETSKVLAASILIIYMMVIVEVFLREIASPFWLILILAAYSKKLDLEFKQTYRNAFKEESFHSKNFRIIKRKAK